MSRNQKTATTKVIRWGMKGSYEALIPDNGPGTTDAKPEKTRWKDRPMVEKLGIVTSDLIVAALVLTLFDYLALHGDLSPGVQAFQVQVHGQYAHAMQFAGNFIDSLGDLKNGRMTFNQFVEVGRNIGNTAVETNPDVIRPMAPFWEKVFAPLNQ